QPVRLADAELRHDGAADRGTVPELRRGAAEGTSRETRDRSHVARRSAAPCRGDGGRSQQTRQVSARARAAPALRLQPRARRGRLQRRGSHDRLQLTLPAGCAEPGRTGLGGDRIEGRIEPRSGPGGRGFGVSLCYNAHANLVGFYLEKWEFQRVHIGGIQLLEFRNYRTLRYTPSPRLNLLIGLNAQGKTNLLEGLAFLLTGRSFRTGRLGELPRWGETTAAVSGELCRREGVRSVR